LIAIQSFEDILTKVKVYEAGTIYSETEIIEYDALTSRYQRALETLFYFFKTFDYYNFQVEGKTARDILHSMEKFDIVIDANDWINMRIERNKIAHIYLQNELGNICNKIIQDFSKLILDAKVKIIEISKNLD
jgi:hypothetical protein